MCLKISPSVLKLLLVLLGLGCSSNKCNALRNATYRKSFTESDSTVGAKNRPLCYSLFLDLLTFRLFCRNLQVDQCLSTAGAELQCTHRKRRGAAAALVGNKDS